MMRVLYVVANPKEGENSFSMAVGREFIETLKEVNQDIIIEEINLYEMELQEIDIEVLSAWGKLREGKDLTTNEQVKVNRINAVTEQFMNADYYVFSSPLWNLNLPPRLKTYFDNVVIARRTFYYNEKGVAIGMLENRKAVYILASGGIHSTTDADFKEFASPYIEVITSFMGIEFVGTIYVEGMAYSPEKAEEIKNEAIDRARSIAKGFITKPVTV